MIQVSLYINSTELDVNNALIDNWTHADLDTSVNISLNDSIKDAKDIGKVMTAYTNQFKLPASKVNNKIFKYFHNHNVLNGFDARRKHEAIIKLNGFDYKKGYIKLNKVNLKNNSPESYDIQFFGELASLKDILGNADLKDLTSLAKYNHEYSLSNVKDGFEEGLGFYTSPSGTQFVFKDKDGAIKYPLISHTRLFEYDNQQFHRLLSEEEKDDGYVVLPIDRISYNDIKPAIRVTKVIEAIEETFPSIVFDKTWIESQEANSGSPFDDLFMWLHRDKGYITYGQDIESKTFWANLKDGTGEFEYEYASGATAGILPLNTFFNGNTQVFYTCEFEVTPDGSGENQIVVILLNNGEVYDAIIRNESGTTTISFGLPAAPSGYWEIITQVFPASDVSNIVPKLTLNKFNDPTYGNISAVYGSTSFSLVKDIIVPLLMPKKKIIDFLSDLFKMFNLVAHEERQIDGSYKIYLESLDSFYGRGISYDVTKYVDISNSSVERIAPYGSISMKFPEPKTFLAINQRQITGDDFGNVEFRVDNFDEGNNTSSSLLFDGGEYTIEPKFEKVMYERLTDTSNSNITDIQIGLYVNDNKENIPEPVVGEALLFYASQENTYSYPIKWSDGVYSRKYNRPSNVNPNGGQTLHFNEEFDEWTLQTNTNSLFNNFYLKYISGIYSPYARRYVIDCYLPPLIFSNIKLKDTIVVADVAFLIESIKTNLSTGKTSLKLLRVTDFETKYVAPPAEELVWNTEASRWEEKSENWEDATAGRTPEVNVSIQLMLRDLQARAEYYENNDETIELLEELIRC